MLGKKVNRPSVLILEHLSGVGSYLVGYQARKLWLADYAVLSVGWHFAHKQSWSSEPHLRSEIPASAVPDAPQSPAKYISLGL